MEPNQEISEDLTALMEKGIEEFKLEAKEFPELIIIYRDGVGESQQDYLRILELESMKKGFQRGYNPKLIFATINKKGTTRFFQKGDIGMHRGKGSRGKENIGGEGLVNPIAGTVVIDQIVSEKEFEFLLMPHYVNQGTGTLTHVRVLESNLAEGRSSIEDFIQITNCFCYIYYNWMGPIRTPAPCAYALAAARMRAKYTKAQTTTPNNLYYI